MWNQYADDPAKDLEEEHQEDVDDCHTISKTGEFRPISFKLSFPVPEDLMNIPEGKLLSSIPTITKNELKKMKEKNCNSRTRKIQQKASKSKADTNIDGLQEYKAKQNEKWMSRYQTTVANPTKKVKMSSDEGI